jgi:hypothetical protein
LISKIHKQRKRKGSNEIIKPEYVEITGDKEVMEELKK